MFSGSVTVGQNTSLIVLLKQPVTVSRCRGTKIFCTRMFSHPFSRVRLVTGTSVTRVPRVPGSFLSRDHSSVVKSKRSNT